MNQAFYSNFLNTNNDKYAKWSAYSGIIGAITGTLTLIIQVLAGQLFQTWWYAILPMILILPLLIIFVEKIRIWIISNIRETKIAKTNHAKLLNYLSEFLEHAGTNSATNIVFVLSSINKIGYQLQRREFAELCEIIIHDLEEDYQNMNHSFSGFRKTVQRFGLVIIKFENLYFNVTMQEIKKLDSDVISIEQNKKIETSRQNFVNFLDRFRSFYNELNKQLGRKEFGYYFNIPQQL